jgi:hypothetical protein
MVLRICSTQRPWSRPRSPEPFGLEVHALRGDVVSGSDAPEAFFAGHDPAFAVYRAVRGEVERWGAVDVRVSKSQVAFRRRRGFAYVWLPGMYLAKPGADVVLSIALDREVASPRFKEIVHPAPRTWMHHLEIRSIDDIDDEVRDWLRQAFDAAA